MHYTPLEAAFEDVEKPDYIIYEIVLYLLEYGADPNVDFVNGGTALQVAESRELHYVAEIIEDYSAEFTTSIDSNRPKVFDTYENG